MVDKSSCLMFLHFLDDDINCEPKILSSVFMSCALTISAFVLSAPVPHEMVSYNIKTKSTIRSVSKLDNLLAFCKALVGTLEKTSGEQHTIFC